MKKIHLDYQLYIQREKHFFHQPYRNEVDFYDAICNGDLEYIEKCKRDFEDVYREFTTMEGKGVLSLDSVRNERYHFIVNAAIITRKCIDAGMLQEDAYTLSDLYIRTVDEEGTVVGIQELNDQMVREFAGKIRQIKVGKVGSKHISRIIQYIYDHLHEKITMDILCEYTSLTPAYLSMLFKKETGMTVHEFIQKKRLETAHNMLREERFSSAEISAMLGFSSQSHFIKLFRETYGITPGEYKRVCHSELSGKES